MSDFEEIKQLVSLEEFAERHLARARAGGKYVCPCCNSGGSGKGNSDSGFSIKGDKWKCFSCNRSGDVFDLAGAKFKTDDPREQLEIVAEFANVSIDDGGGRGFKSIDWSKVGSSTKAPAREEQPDYSQARKKEYEYVGWCQKRIWESGAVEYLLGRGFTKDEISRYGFGYDPEATGAKGDSGKWLNPGRIVIPWRGCSYYHIDRLMTDVHVPNGKYKKPASDKIGSQPVDNLDAASKADELFVVEGMFDALAVDALGFTSLGLGGTSYQQAIDALVERGFNGVLILMLDGDETGKQTQLKAYECAKERLIKVFSADFTALTGCKDASEALEKDRNGAREALEKIVEDARAKIEEEKEQPTTDDLGALSIHDAGGIAAAVLSGDGLEVPVHTGFSSLDSVLGGGLRPGLIVLGAASSIGKTTFFVQVGDWIAKYGRPVLFVTIEQSGREIVCKSLSRIMDGAGTHGITIWDMNDKIRRMVWGERENSALEDAVKEYTDSIAHNMKIMSADKQPTVMDIRNAAAAVKNQTGEQPVIMIDYLQLIRPIHEGMGDKQAADFNVSELRRIARDMRTPVLVISSLNRSSYDGVIKMDSYKESGGIEYGADVLLGIQPLNMEKRLEAVKESKRAFVANQIMEEFKSEAVRECEIVILKNRNGKLPKQPIPITFYTEASRFTCE